MNTTEKRFEEDIESFLVSAQGGYTKTTDTYDAGLGLYLGTLINFKSQELFLEYPICYFYNLKG